MTSLLILASTVQTAALAGALDLLRRTRDTRLWFLVALMGAGLVRIVLTTAYQGAATGGSLLEVFGSLLSAGIVVFLFRLYRERGRLRLEEAYFQRLFAQSPEAIVLLGVDDRVIRMNSGFEKLFGWAEDAVVGHRLSDLIVPAGREDEALRLTHSVAEGGNVSVDATERRRKDGSTVHVSILGTPVWIDGGRAAVYGIYRDMSAQNAAESALRLSEEKHRAVLDNIQDSFYELDLSGALTAFNRSLCDLLGHQPSELGGAALKKFTDDVNSAKLDTLFDWVATRGRSAGLVEWEFIRKDGEVRSIEGSISPVFDSQRKVSGFRGIVRDVTERHEAEEVVRRQWKAIETSMDGMAITGPRGKLQYVNDAFVAMYGYASAAELLGVGWEMLYDDSEQLRINAVIHPLIKQRGQWHGEAVGLRKDGSRFAQEISLSRLDNGGITAGVRDVTERRAAERALQESEERYALAALGANDGLWDWNLQTQRVYYSPRWKSMLGLAEDEVGTSAEDWLSRVHPYDRAALDDGIAQHLAGAGHALEIEFRIKHRDNSYRWVLCRGIAQTDDNRQAVRMSGSLADITERKSAEERLQHDALHDALTGMPNRALLMDRMRQALDRVHRRGDYLFAVLFLDLDRFKVINDSLGHAIGDQLLITMANRLKQCVRPEDSVARLGGDEFVVLLDGVDDPSEATTIADRIQATLSRPVRVDNRDVFTSASIGIALSSQGYANADHILRDADTAMYRAKSLGKSRHELFDTEMHHLAMERLTIETDLRRVLELDQLTLDYQPIFEVESGKLIALEALLRWHHPERGLINPASFVPIAEETGMILPIGLWVLEEACQTLRRFHETVPGAHALTMHVNLSGRQLREPSLIADIQAIFRRTGVDPQHIGFEITESVVMEDAPASIRMLDLLRSTNVRLQIDDFGTGYSSLSYLNRFPIDTLKIDRSFVSNVGPNAENSEIVRSIISLGHDLGLRVIAEGVETEQQLEFLRTVGCDACQGHLLSRPLDLKLKNLGDLIGTHYIASPTGTPSDGQTDRVFQVPRLKARALTTASDEKDKVIETKTPAGPKPNTYAST